VLYFIKKYPFSITLVLTVLYLSFAKPPQVEIMYFPYMDKVVHFCMYAGISGVLWLEFFLNYRKCEILPVRHALIGAVLCPIIFGGLIEIGQHYLTSYRGGEWLDLLANTTGVIAGSLVSWIFVRKLFRRKERAGGKRHR
jgi:VanZ family protein